MNNDPRPRKVLFVLGSMHIGGVQSGIMNFAQITPKEDAVFDVLVLTGEVGFHEEEFSKYGTVYHLPVKTSKSKLLSIILKPIYERVLEKRLIRFLKTHPKYDVVHSKHLTMSGAIVRAAKKCKIPVRVAQSHVDKPDRMNFLTALDYKRNARIIENCATHKLAVSEKAADLMFAHYGGTVIKNPTISLKRLDPSLYQTAEHDGIHLIHIGTYSRRKNQIFSLEIGKALLDMGQKIQLTFVGYPLDEPDYFEIVKQTAVKFNMIDSVSFLPKDSDIPQLLAEHDYMLLPSTREGLPNVALEAQAMGVPCFLSDAITNATDCGLCTFLSLSLTPNAWAERILAYREAYGTAKRYVDMSAWDNQQVVQEYVKIWRNL